MKNPRAMKKRFNISLAFADGDARANP